MQEFEKLGVFYLGKTYDPVERRRSDEYLLYNSKDLTTHAICVGMTGSGKTGLCVNLLEEAAIDGIPALIIDPKGDMSNLMLNFAQLTAEDLLPWVSADEAAGLGLSTADFARAESERWIRGLADWEQTPDRARMMREQASFEIYTPGSLSGRPLNVLRTLSAPGSNPPPDQETLYELAGGTVSGMLSLIGLDRLLSEPTAGITFDGLNPEVETQSNHAKWRNGLQDYAYRNSTVEILYNPTFKEYSAVGEEEREFIIRLRQLTRERRDEQLQILRDRYAKRIAALQEKVRKADQALQREEEQAKNAKSQVAISLGSTILGAFMGRNALSVGTVGKAATTARGASRSQRQAGDVARSKETLATYQADLEALEKEFQTEVEALATKLDTDVDRIETVSLKPLKRDCLVQSQVVLWLPYQQGSDGLWHPAWRRDVYEDQIQ